MAPVEREQLPDGLQQLVRDEAITAANSPEFAVARQAWESDADFVDQVDYQLEFRSHVDFMSRDYEHIAALLTERPVNMGSEEMGLYMSNAEVAEMERRDALGDRMDLVVEAVAGIGQDDTVEGELPDYGPNYGGIWQDQLDGGRIVLAVVDASLLDVESLHRILGGADHLEIVEQPSTYNEIEEYRQMLESELEKLGVPSDVAAVCSDRGRLLEVRVADPESLPESFGNDVPPGAFEIVGGDPVRDAARPVDQRHAWANQQPGLKVLLQSPNLYWGEWCTWGFNGHTPSFHYLITAAHCLQDGGYDTFAGYAYDLEVLQAGSSARNLTPTYPYVVSLRSNGSDVARISSPYADDNCYHGNHYASTPAHCRWKMSARAFYNSWEIGSDRTCASLGSSAVYRCGYILKVNHGGSRVRVGMPIAPGDSGSGAQYQNRIDGIIASTTDWSDAIFVQAYYVQVYLGDGYFYFNCAEGRTTHSNPNDWGACPIVNA
jgi:hypothetical protein